jgi:hypothetical protein
LSHPDVSVAVADSCAQVNNGVADALRHRRRHLLQLAANLPQPVVTPRRGMVVVARPAISGR